VSDDVLRPVFAELNRRHARLFLHPTSPACWEQTSFNRPRPMVEFLFETTRTVVDLILNGTVAAFPDIGFVIPHAGATLPLVADRVSAFSLILPVDPAVDVLRDLGRLHFDLAGFPLPRQFDALLTMTSIRHLHYGSDYPFTPEFVAAAARNQLADVTVSSTHLLTTLRENTDALFPPRHVAT
jgi:6-methylsalicylate decarboxylase